MLRTLNCQVQCRLVRGFIVITLAVSTGVSVKQRSGVCPSVRLSVPSSWLTLMQLQCQCVATATTPLQRRARTIVLMHCTGCVLAITKTERALRAGAAGAESNGTASVCFGPAVRRPIYFLVVRPAWSGGLHAGLCRANTCS